MTRSILSFLLFLNLTAFGQDSLTARAQPIVEEGKRLYRSEMASWYGTDLFLESYKDNKNIGGYFSYSKDNVSTCVFFSKGEDPKVIGTILFDSTYNTKTATVDLNERSFTVDENDLYIIRKIALSTINSDTLFKQYNNTNLNLIPLIHGNEKKVYVLTGPKQNGVVVFGNDYLLDFNRDNTLVRYKRLHKNIIPIYFGGKEEEGKEVEASVHSHLPETGEFITATDICTLMLYEKMTKWKQHNVVSREYLNIWNCLTDELTVIPMSTINKINKGQEKRNKKRNREE